MIKSLRIAIEGTYNTGKTELAKELSNKHSLNFVHEENLDKKLTMESNEMFFVTDCTPINFLVRFFFENAHIGKKESFDFFKKAMKGMNYDFIFLIPHDTINPEKIIYNNYARDNLMQSAIAGYLLNSGLMHGKKVRLIQKIKIQDRIKELEQNILYELNLFQQIQILKNNAKDN